MEEIRWEALRGLVILAIHDDQFRRGAMTDLEGTLERYAFALNDQEMAEIRTFHGEVVNRLDEELIEELRRQLPPRR